MRPTVAAILQENDQAECRTTWFRNAWERGLKSLVAGLGCFKLGAPLIPFWLTLNPKA